MKALSIRQPNAEPILRGKKKIEYRNMPTNKRERIIDWEFRIPNRGIKWQREKP